MVKIGRMRFPPARSEYRIAVIMVFVLESSGDRHVSRASSTRSFILFRYTSSQFGDCCGAGGVAVVGDFCWTATGAMCLGEQRGLRDGSIVLVIGILVCDDLEGKTRPGANAIVETVIVRWPEC